MKNRRIKAFASLLFTIFVGIVGQTAQGQSPEYDAGAPVTSVTVPVERGFVNLVNGNLHIEIPFAAYQGRGKLSASFKMVYDSMIWHGITAMDGSKHWDPSNVPHSMGGWRFSSSLSGIAASGEPSVFVCGTGGTSATQWGPFQITTLDGTQHTFPIITIYNAFPTGACAPTQYKDTPTGTGYAIDGSGYYAQVTNYDNIVVYDQTGTRIYESVSGATNQVDPNGNYNDSSHDDLGRPIFPVVSKSADGNTTYYDVLTAYGKTERYSVTTESIPLNTHFLSDSVGSDFQGNITVVQSIGLPDGSSYTFSYESLYGELSGITLPNQGVVSYIYQSGLNGTRAGEAVPPRWVSSHTGSNGTTTFSIIPANCPGEGGIGQIGPCNTQHNYVTRNGSTTDYNFSLHGNSGYFNDFIYSHTADKNSSVVRTAAKTYDFSTLCPVAVCNNNTTYLYPTLTTLAEVFNDTMMTRYTSYSYSTPAVGIPNVVKQWDYYTSTANSTPPYAPSGPASRETDATLGYSVNGALFPTLVATTDASGQLSLTNFSYDDPGHIVSSPVTPPNHNDSYVTGNRGNLTTVSRWLNTNNTYLTTLLYYDSAGALQYSIDPLLNQTSYGYDATDTFITSVTQPATNGVQHTSQATYDFSTGLVLTQKDENMQVTNYAYDSLGRPYTVTAPNGAVTTTTYPSASETDITDMQSASVSVPSVVLVDSFGRPSMSTVAGVSSGTTYDSFGRVSCVTTPHTTAASATDGSTCNTVYDQFDRVQTIQQPDGNTVGLSYSDNAVTTTDEVGHKHQNTYNAFGDLTSVFEQDNAGTLDWQTVYQYDGLDRLMRVDQKGASTVQANWRTRTFAYDSLGRLTHQTTPEAGTLTFNTYDADGNLLLATDARGLTVQYHYDALNRVTSKALQNGSTYVYNYDASDSSSDPYGVGRLTSVQNGSNVGAHFTHDLSGNVASEKYCLPSNCSYTQAVQATYDYHGNAVSLTYPDGRSVYRSYDLLDRLTQTGENSFLTGASRAAVVPYFTRPRPYFSGAVYYPAGELNSAVYGTVLNLATAFNSRQDLTALKYTNSQAQPLWSKAYSWDQNGVNLLSVTDQISGNVRQFSYDYVNRLASTMDSSGGVADTYTMDAWGNRQESGTFTFTQPFSAANQISASGYVYDSSGNLTADGLGNTYSYDADGKMSASNGAVYTRDSFGQRVRKDYSGAATEYFYFGGALLATRDPSTSHWTDYIYAEGRLIAEIPVTSTDTPFYRIGDHLDSLAQKTDSAGNLLGTNDVSPFGELFSSTASDRLLFTQHERDAENSSDSALYRQYASTQGRWLAPDPYNGSYDLSDPQSLNRYAYVANRPLAATDPLGLGPWDSFLEFITAGQVDHDDNNGPKVSANVETTFGNPYLSANGTVVFPENVGVSYSTAGGVFRNLPLPDASFFFRVYSFAFSPSSPRVAATVAPNNPTRLFLPPNAQTCTGMGKQFYAPPQFNLSNVTAAGQAGGRFNLSAMNSAVGHFGTFDYQRVGTPSSFTFYSGYTPVSNIDVGAYLYGAGFSQSQAGMISNTFASLFSKNAGDPNQAIYRNLGYQMAAGKGSYSCSAIPQ